MLLYQIDANNTLQIYERGNRKQEIAREKKKIFAQIGIYAKIMIIKIMQMHEILKGGKPKCTNLTRISTDPNGKDGNGGIA